MMQATPFHLHDYRETYAACVQSPQEPFETNALRVLFFLFFFLLCFLLLVFMDRMANYSLVIRYCDVTETFYRPFLPK